MTEGQTQARLAAVLCDPLAGWFIIAEIIKFEMYGEPVAEMPFTVTPLAFWTIPALSEL